MQAMFDKLPVRVLGAGVAGLVVWEVFARLIAPVVFGFTLDPTQLIEIALGVTGVPAELLHLITGLVAFPFGYVVVVAPLVPRLFGGRLPWAVAGLGYGVGLWVFAMYGMASVLGGMPPFLGFAPVAWASLVGHVGLGLGMAGALAFMTRGEK